MHPKLFALLCLVLPRLTSPQAVGAGQFHSLSGSHECDFSYLHPRRYAAYHLPPPTNQFSPSISIDGVLDEKVWAEVPWSEPFQDIRGAAFWSQPWFATKFKLRYDQKFLYLGAYIEETEVWANVSQRNEVIFHDNDFEVFVDADGSTHNYKEFELNARNATWNLWLNRPYRDGGHENSTRVDPKHGFDMLNGGMQSAVFVKGPINDPSERLHYWTVEIALPLQELASHSSAKVPPVSNSFWRINFSRVEWAVRVATDSYTGKQHYEKKAGLNEENWVWSAQYAVDMHRPEWWGYLQFRPQGQSPPRMSDEVPLDPEWGVRYVSFQFYYAQHAFHKVTGTYTSSLEHLLPYFTSREAIECTSLLDTSATEKSFSAQIGLRTNDRFVASIEEDGYITVEKVSKASITPIE
ncbi:hypothetical protein F441_19123 [Phytophthora nicotianae CJ01A1]|uniref:Carbohydrate-binding domain-containing protein n=2 Tax=Phytophthora nicotianae TaxID=4792 RepID=W2I364_PHYNI|nr:hypothetical protein L916_18631 [Phytophthora nicotianae]ETL81157.1 hypothetical protein L917_18456 [Phytophthora nicotianae]ETP04028.1 hypothetical protein F441_19123 [Phytophthora nicotianae CJ01A1]